jgi:alpha-beta hydrolase superfamily lysophospholipase
MRILLLLVFTLLASATQAQSAGTETGRLGDADYRIDLPANWNRSLVVYFHGYSIDPIRFRESSPPYTPLKQLVDRGYAVIQSAYSRTGWAVEQAIGDSERLRRHFVSKHGKPKETFAMGMSMGGLLTVQALESQPKIYAGGLSLCGVLAPADTFLQRGFALRAAFDFYFPDLLGPLVPVPADYLPTDAVVRRIAEALRANPHASSSLRALHGAATDDNFPGVLAFLTYVIKEMQQRAGGSPFDNSNLIHTGSDDDFALNDGVHRYRSDAQTARYMSRWYTPNGKLERPLLALHTSGDPLVPASTAFDYAVLVQRAGQSDHFVQQYVNAEGHCTMSAEQTLRTFEELVAWVHGGLRPVPGALP